MSYVNTGTSSTNENAQSSAWDWPPLEQAHDEQRPFDFTINFHDGSLSAHGDVLASRSYYFEALLDSRMMEALSRTVKFNHISKATMTVVLDFIYNRTPNISTKNAPDILVAAHYLQIPELITMCLEFVKDTISPSSVFALWKAADECLIDDLADIVIDFIVKNLTQLMGVERFLSKLEAPMMEILLESDQIVVPNEDSVCTFLISWCDINRSVKSKIKYVNTFRELIRFPFLTVRTVLLLEEKLGPLKGLRKLKTGNWNLEMPAFKRRRYTMPHVHVLWHQCSIVGNNLPQQQADSHLILTCNIPDRPQELIFKKPLLRSPCQEMMIRMIRSSVSHGPGHVAVSGHTTYVLQLHSVFAIPSSHSYSTPRAERDFTTVKPNQIVNGTKSGDFPIALQASKNGHLHILSIGVNCEILALNTWTGRSNLVKKVKVSGSAIRGNYAQLTLDTTNARLVEPATGRWIRLRTPASFRDGVHWISMTQRGDTAFCWFADRNTKHIFMISLDLESGQWSEPIETHVQAPRSIHSKLINEDIYMLVVDRKHRGDDEIHVNKLDEETGTFQKVQSTTLTDSRFVGLTPADSTPCPMDTWLSVEIRKLPDKTPKQRAWIERLRELAG